MALDKSIIKEALGNLRKELRGVTGKRKLSAITITIAPGGHEEPDGDEENGAEEATEDQAQPDIVKRAMQDLKGG